MYNPLSIDAEFAAQRTAAIQKGNSELHRILTQITLAIEMGSTYTIYFDTLSPKTITELHERKFQLSYVKLEASNAIINGWYISW